MPRIDFNEVGEFPQPRQRIVEERSCPLLAVLHEVGPSQVANQQKVCCQQAPGIVATTVVENQEVDLLRTMTGRMEDLQRYITELKSITGPHARSFIGDLGELRQHQLAITSHSQPSCPGYVVRMTVRVNDVADAGGLGCSHTQVWVHVPQGIEDRTLASDLGANHVGDTARLRSKERLEPHDLILRYQGGSPIHPCAWVAMPLTFGNSLDIATRIDVAGVMG